MYMLTAKYLQDETTIVQIPIIHIHLFHYQRLYTESSIREVHFRQCLSRQCLLTILLLIVCRFSDGGRLARVIVVKRVSLLYATVAKRRRPERRYRSADFVMGKGKRQIVEGHGDRVRRRRRSVIGLEFRMLLFTRMRRVL